MVPDIHYAMSGDVSIAYQVVGEGPRDLVMIPGFLNNIELAWEEPNYAQFLTRLSTVARLIFMDRRGTGLSDRVAQVPSLETRMDDVRAVMDAAGSQHATLFGISEGGPMSLMFAATYPDRVDALILGSSTSRFAWAPDYPWGVADDTIRRYASLPIEDRVAFVAKSRRDDPAYLQWYARWNRLCASPGAAAMIIRIAVETDARHVLSAIRAPTLILHSANDGLVVVQHGRFLAEQIAGAKYVELPGPDHLPWLADAEAVLGEITEFLTGARASVEPDRVLATVLFTDIVGATEKAASIGDRAWRGLLGNHHAAVRRNLNRFRGREIDTAGDGFLAAFDGPARAVRCARAISDEVRGLGIEVRAGLHTGECELMGEKLGGIAVHIGARVASLAGPGEVLVSSTVKDLVAGSGLNFADRGLRALKGVPGEWRLFAAEG
ncbi:MAG TPA: adenylate/guanylate cyclase domain-containing protein [Stellaceae bacterium]|nr:adenylate/guanylate cyclase domain-containing protein [Stellaceae bacterium]